ncbi:hypothetical protein HY004_03105 [Candidatus Saccharibacteria bacterium]|nr:hypothetical protein [Candidatus Saccharibacteria bacterium]
MAGEYERVDYDSGGDYILELEGMKFTFNEIDFYQRIELAAKRLGIIDPGVTLSEYQREDLASIVLGGEFVVDLITDFGEHIDSILRKQGKTETGMGKGSLVHWLRRVTFRDAWLDQMVEIGELENVFNPETGDFIRVSTETGEVIPLVTCPSWAEYAYRP